MVVNWVYVNKSLRRRVGDGKLLTDAPDSLIDLFKVWQVDPPRQDRVRDAAFTIAQFLLRPNYIWNWFELLDAPFCRASKGVQLAEYRVKKLQRFKPVVPIVNRQFVRATIAYAVCSYVESRFYEAALIDCPPCDERPELWDALSLPIDVAGEKIRVIPLIRFAARPTVASILGLRRKCGLRDHLWLQWRRKKNLTPAKIRDAWNKLSDDQRKVKSPHWFKKIKQETGVDIVKKALKAAEKEIGDFGSELGMAGLS